MRRNPLAITDAERPFVERLAVSKDPLGDQVRWQDCLAELGYSNAMVLGATAWAGRQANGVDDRTNSATRSRYRKMFGELGAVLPPGEGPSDRPLDELGAARARRSQRPEPESTAASSSAKRRAKVTRHIPGLLNPVWCSAIELRTA